MTAPDSTCRSMTDKRYGITLALTSVAFWGLLPIVSKGVLSAIDPYTLNFYRFLLVTPPLLLYLFIRRQPLPASGMRVKHYLLLLAAIGGLLGNHIMFIDALAYIPAGASQIIIQLGPVSLLIISVLLLGESFSSAQWLGTGIFLSGLLLFFHRRLEEIIAVETEYAFGIVYMVLASLVWVFYGLGQKLLGDRLSPALILLATYILGILVLLPVSSPAVVLQLNSVELALLLATSFTSLIAYICFGEAMVRWQTAKCSAMLATIPLLALGYEAVFALLLPAYISAEKLSPAMLAGAVMVVLGCLIVTGFQHPDTKAVEHRANPKVN